MNKFIKGALIFTSGIAGGFVLCGITTIKLVVNSNTFRTAIKDKIANEVTTFLGFHYGEKQPRQIDIIIETRKDAEDVLSCVNDIFENYGTVSVADLYDICGLSSNYKDNKIGWKDSYSVSKMYILRTKYGYQLKLPKPVELA